MKFVFVAMALISCQFASAQLTVKQSTIGAGELRLAITGQDALRLQKYVGELDSTNDIVAGAKDGDQSRIRRIRCANNSCEIIYTGRAFTNKDAEDYYGADFNKKIKSLTNSQALIASEIGMEGPGSASLVDAKIVRLLFENSENNKDIKLVPSLLTKKVYGDHISSLLYTVSLNLKSVQIKCYSSIITGMGERNLLEETCGVTGIAEIK